jgi:hypothetical protein
MPASERLGVFWSRDLVAVVTIASFTDSLHFGFAAAEAARPLFVPVEVSFTLLLVFGTLLAVLLTLLKFSRAG